MAERKYVCKEYVGEPYLWQAASVDLRSKKCDYCQRTSKRLIACEVSEVITRMRSSIEREYHDPANELPYDEGEYIGTWFAGVEILDDIGYYPGNELLREDFVEALAGEAFCKQDYFGGTAEDVFGMGWRRFCELVQTKRRYTFWNSVEKGEFQDPSYGISAVKLLSMIGGNISYLSPVIEIPAGTPMWRVRVFDLGDAGIADPKVYASPPLDKAVQDNRMSPAGISMFYGCVDIATAYVETVEPDKMKGKVARGATFATLVPLNLLDLTHIPSAESFFDEGWDKDRREASQFLQSFADTLSKPIKRDKRQHIEYVPTQVFTEYVRYELKTEGGEPFHGIKYRSSINGKDCFVVFADQEECLPGTPNPAKPQIMEFVPGSIRKAKRAKKK